MSLQPFFPNIQGNLRGKADNNIWDLMGAGAPTDGTSGTGAGIAGKLSTYYDLTNGVIYINGGTKASPTWYVDTVGSLTGDVTVTSGGVTAIGASKVVSAMLDRRLVRLATGQITAANLTGTAAGQFGHANGVELVAAPGANVALILIAAVASYVRSTASYGAGGDTTVNWGGGGAALTGLVSNANFAAAGSDKPVVFYPLTTAAVVLVPNTGINLVTTAAFTQPGTAAGVINWKVLYSTQVLNTAA